MITHNRPDYTKISLECLCNTAPQNLKLTIWDNNSDSATKEVVDKFRNHRCVERVIFNETNEKLRRPTNWFWENSLDADLLGKVDDDCLVSEDWCRVLEQAHRDIPAAGVLACCRFLSEDFDYERASKKISTFGTHQVLRNCWVQGSGYLMKREVIHRNGFLKPKETFTTYCVRAAAKGYINGWYYPFLFEEHMDDPRVSHTGIRSEEDFQRLIPLSARAFGIKTREQWTQRLTASAQRLQEYSIDPYDFIGFRAKVNRKIASILGREYFPKVK
jgi:glycosyltransferase involved in cell wall biosynthesis